MIYPMPVYSNIGYRKRQKNDHPIGWPLDVGIFLSSRAVASQVFSTSTSLTSVFGMGTGGPSLSSTPTILFSVFPDGFIMITCFFVKIKGFLQFFLIFQICSYQKKPSFHFFNHSWKKGFLPKFICAVAPFRKPARYASPDTPLQSRLLVAVTYLVIADRSVLQYEMLVGKSPS